MTYKFRVARTDKTHGFEHERCARFFTSYAKVWINFILMTCWEKSTLHLPERHHMAWLVFFLSRRKGFGKHSAAAAGNSA